MSTNKNINAVKISNYAKHLIVRKFYPRQAECVRGYTRNPNAAVYNMLRNGK